jgi:hypothetical protein
MMASGGGGDLNVGGCLDGCGLLGFAARDRARNTASGGYLPEMTVLPLCASLNLEPSNLSGWMLGCFRAAQDRCKCN